MELSSKMPEIYAQIKEALKNISLEKFYNKIKDVEIGLCAKNIKKQNYKYENGELIKK